MDDSVDKIFDAAAAHLPNLLKDAKEEDLLYLYARYKQAITGDCEIAKPSFWELEKKRKWNAWNELKSISKENAKKEYIERIKLLDPSFSSDNQLNKNTSPGFGVSVSRPLYEEETDVEEKYKEVFNICKDGDLIKLKEKLKSTQLDAAVIKDAENRTLLHWSCDRGKLNICQYLIINCRADVNVQDDDLLTPLHYAIQCENKEIILLLLKSGADLEIKDCDGATALAEASSEINKFIKTSGF